MSNLQHIKASRTRILNTFPKKEFGFDGDIVISRISGKGTFLCSKADGVWYVANQMQEISRIGKASIRELTTNKLTVNKMLNTERSADRFVVNDGGSIKYRTGKQIVDDLSLPFNNIDYKTAYCSLGQYSDKDSCESNGGTWYYSENDSHDSISSTPENQLLTIGQSIGTVDAEPTLTYDGSVFQIKNNLNYDDNWQSSVQEPQIRLHDGTYYTGFKAHGTMTADCLYTLPAEYPGANKVLQSDTSGNLTWVSDVGTITALNNATATELVTVGSSITELDAQSNLTFDGNKLVVNNAEVLIPQFIVTADGGTDYLYINNVGNGASTIGTTDAAGDNADLEIKSDGNMTLTVGLGSGASDTNFTVDGFGNIILDAANNNIIFKDNGTEHGRINMSTASKLRLQSASNYSCVIESQGTGDVELDSSGDIILDSADGNFIAKKAGTEFSAANSAYAGMILGYTRLEGDLTNYNSYEIENAITVEDDTHKVTFKTPPSELVEISCQVNIGMLSTSTRIFVGLSTANATDGYSKVDEKLEYEVNGIAYSDGEADDGNYEFTFVVDADDLNAVGSDNTFWIGFGTADTTKTAYIQYGLRASHNLAFAPFIIKATALPATIYDGQ